GIVGDEDVATLKALAATGPSPDDFAAIAACLRAVGFTRMRWARHRPDGRVMVKVFNTARREARP
ncbi:MAG TPA: hypothetical protein VMS01_04035, partial [Stellaceae bacterium]|nr:hypothetical protein [Stellaceae bacterium]